MEKKTIGGFIAALRKAQGMTQQELADRLCVSNKTVSKWECCESFPEITLVPVIAEIFGVTSDEILRGERAAKESAPNEKGAARVEQQTRRLLQSSILRYKTVSCIAAGLFLVGYVVLLVLSFVAYEPGAGFGVMTVFLIAGVVLQIVGISRANSALSGEGMDERLLTPVRQTLIRYAFHVFWIGAAVTLLSLPAIIEIEVVWPTSIVIMSAFDFYFYQARPLAVCALVLYWAAKWAVNALLKRDSRYEGITVFPRSTRATVLWLCVSVVCAILLLV